MLGYAMFGMWLGALGVPGEQRALWVLLGAFSIALGAAGAAWALRARRIDWAARMRWRSLGWVLLAAGLRSPPEYQPLDVPRQTEAWFWTDGPNLIRDSSGLRLRCYDSLAPGFGYRLRVELHPLDTALAPWAFDAARAAAPRRIIAQARVSARL
ncbi:MAG: hypothetical protein ACO28T_04745, partial [Schleiferiaceae bacterium]